MIDHFVRECTCGSVHSADDNVSPLVDRMQMTVKAD